MKEKIKHALHHLHPLRITESLYLFLRDESIGGKLVIAAALLSIVAINSPLQNAFYYFWQQPLSIGLGYWKLEMSLVHWLNEAFMAFFFLVVGLEIKREFVRGELRSRESAILPIGAAVGGVIIPALFYLTVAGHTPGVHGWGIATATDTAIAVAILGLLGSRVPIQLKIFLLALAVADDVLAVIVISLFYAGDANLSFVACSILIIIGIYLFRSYLAPRLWLVLLLGASLWLMTHLSGIHASIVGVVMGLLAPIPERGREVSTPEKVERFFLPITTLFVVPLFAFANAGFVISLQPFIDGPFVIAGIAAGLIAGKVIGIVASSWILVKLRIARLPDTVNWRHIIGVGFIAGIGFTVSLFIAELAFPTGSVFVDAAKVGIFIASTISGLIGLAILSRTSQSE